MNQQGGKKQTRARVKGLKINSPTYEFGTYQGWQLEISFWEADSSVTLKDIRDQVDKLFVAKQIDQCSLSGDGSTVYVRIRKPEKLCSPTALQELTHWLIVPPHLQPLPRSGFQKMADRYNALRFQTSLQR